MGNRTLTLLTAVALAAGGTASAKTVVLTPGLHHLRATQKREWSDFPARPEGPGLSLRFRAEANAGEWSLRLRQQDIRQTWKVLLNGKGLGRLQADENDMVIYLPVPAGWLRAGENRLTIEQAGRTPDDIRVGEITLEDRPVAKALSEASVEVTVRETGLPGQPAVVPSRITVLTKQEALMTVGTTSAPGWRSGPASFTPAGARPAWGCPPTNTPSTSVFVPATPSERRCRFAGKSRRGLPQLRHARPQLDLVRPRDATGDERVRRGRRGPG